VHCGKVSVQRKKNNPSLIGHLQKKEKKKDSVGNEKEIYEFGSLKTILKCIFKANGRKRLPETRGRRGSPLTKKKKTFSFSGNERLPLFGQGWAVNVKIKLHSIKECSRTQIKGTCD